MEHIVYGLNDKMELTVEDNYIDLVTPPKSSDMCPPTMSVPTADMLPTDEPDVTVEPHIQDRFELPPAARTWAIAPDHVEYVVQFQDHGILPGLDRKRKRYTAIEMCGCDYCVKDKPMGRRAATMWIAQMLNKA